MHKSNSNGAQNSPTVPLNHFHEDFLLGYPIHFGKWLKLLKDNHLKKFPGMLENS